MTENGGNITYAFSFVDKRNKNQREVLAELNFTNAIL